MQRIASLLIVLTIISHGGAEAAQDTSLRRRNLETAAADTLITDTFYLGYTYHDDAGRASRRNIVIDDSQRVHVAWVYQPKPLYGYSNGAYSNTIMNGSVEYLSPGCNVGQGFGLSPLKTVTLDVDTTAAVLVRSIDRNPQIQHQYPDSCAWTLYELLATTGGFVRVSKVSDPI